MRSSRASGRVKNCYVLSAYRLAPGPDYCQGGQIVLFRGRRCKLAHCFQRRQGNLMRARKRDTLQIRFQTPEPEFLALVRGFHDSA